MNSDIFKKHFVIDVESDGPCPGLYNMISFGLSSVYDPTLTFSRLVIPITREGIPNARKVSGISYSVQQERGVTPRNSMLDAFHWLITTMDYLGVDDAASQRVCLWSDNIAYDWQWWNYYCELTHVRNIAGFSGRRIGDLAAGLKNKPLETIGWKKLRITPHTHDPADDAKGNAEALRVLLGLEN